MDQDQNNPIAGVQPSSPAPVMNSTDSKASLMLIGIGITFLILVILGWYMMQGGAPVPALENTQPVGEQNAVSVDETSAAIPAASDTATVALSAQGTSDDVADIDADLKATDLTSLNDIDQI
jgi:Na+-transporting methylmalonyl-CoA/oxaloacetate decarboxylase gamma subunit